MQIHALSNSFAAEDRPGNGTWHSIFKFSSLSGKWLLWSVALSFLAASKSWAGSLPDFSTLIENEADAVVKISVVTGRAAASAESPSIDQLPDQWKKFFEQMPEGMRPDSAPRQGQGFGSGFIISDDGYIITNAHVVDNASSILVGLQDQREYDAELVGSDKRADIALLKVNANELPVVRMGDSDDLKVGEWVLAIGSPFGFEYTATQGIVSAVARDLPADTYVPFIQSDAAVNPGNSGGPLFNTDGEVIGVNSQIYSRSGGYQGLSFSIPINVAKNIAEQLKVQGYVSRGWLGVVIQDVDQALAESFGLDKPTGALIADVSSNSPASKAKLQSGDIIVEFNGKKVTSSGKLPPMVGLIRAGSQVPVKVLRGGDEKIIDVLIEELETDRKAKVNKESSSDSRLGLVVDELTKENREALDVEQGVVISEVKSGSLASEAGLQAGDVIVSIDRKPVDTVEAFKALVKKLPTGKSFPLLIQRDSVSIFRALKIPAS